MTTVDKLTIEELSGSGLAENIDQLSDVLIDCVDGGASVSFMYPMTREKAKRFWQGVVAGVNNRDRALLVARDETKRIIGTVQIILSQPENQPHRADIAKMLVHRDARRRGVAEVLMRSIENLARREGKTVLVLDTVTGGDAERLYARLGWISCGMIPDYALFPAGGLCATTLFYKKLEPHA
jgi:GNAT superfamily N-acetyltransferase